MLLNIDDFYLELKRLRKMKTCEYKDKTEILEFLKICEHYMDNPLIQSQRITILIKLGKLYEALEISEHYIKNKVIQSQRITILIKLGKLNEALEICEQYMDNPLIQSQRITILIKLGKLNEALEICEKHLVYFPIQSQRIAILIELGKLNEALEICEKHFTYVPIQSQRITILIKLGKLDEALEICEQYMDNPLIQSQKLFIVNKLYGGIDEKITLDDVYITNIFRNDDNLNSSILTKIYLDCITEEEIKNSRLDEDDKIVLLVAYYEKKNKKKGIQFIKELKKNNINNRINCYNSLLQRLTIKKSSIFDIAFYMDILNCSINFNTISEFEQRNVEEEKSIKKATEDQQIIKKKKKQSEQKKYIILNGKTVNSRHNAKEYNSTNEKSAKENNNLLLIKDIFYNEIIEIGKQIYLELNNYERQKAAIKAWDILENIAYSSASDKKNLEKMITIINKLYPENRKTNEKKFMKNIK